MNPAIARQEQSTYKEIYLTDIFGKIARRAETVDDFLLEVLRVICMEFNSEHGVILMRDDNAFCFPSSGKTTSITTNTEFVPCVELEINHGGKGIRQFTVDVSPEKHPVRFLKWMKHYLDMAFNADKRFSSLVFPMISNKYVKGIVFILIPPQHIVPKRIVTSITKSLTELCMMIDIIADWHLYQHLDDLNTFSLSLETSSRRLYMCHLLAEAKKRIGCEGISFFTLDRTTSKPSFVLSGTSPKAMPERGIRYTLGDSNVTSMVLAKKQTVVIHYLDRQRHDLSELADAKWKDVETNILSSSVVFVPIERNRRIVGLLRCTNKTSGKIPLFNGIDLRRINSFSSLLMTWYNSAERQKEFAFSLLNISHEIRQATQGIVSACGYVQKRLKKTGVGDNNDENLCKLNHIKTSIHGMIRLLPALGRSDISEQHTHPEASDLIMMGFRPYADLCKPICETYRGQLEEKGIQLDIFGQDQMGRIFADINDFRHVFQNLISNAIKYTFPGKRIFVKLQRSSTHGDHALIRVASESLRIEPEEREFIFMPRYRAKSAIDSGISGGGLGLMISRAIMRRYGGDIEFLSEDNLNIFSIVIPRILFR